MSKNVYEIINQKIIEKLEEALKNGDKPMWKKGWLGGTVNHVTRHQYRGINALLLDPGEYITFKQIKKLQEKNPGIKLRKGSKSEIVVFWKWYKQKKDGEIVVDEEGNEQMFAKPFYYNVFNIMDVDGIEPRAKELTELITHSSLDERVQSYIAREGIALEHIEGGNEAFYSPNQDKVVMPGKDQFYSIDNYYLTLFHEFTHSTGHGSRLNRFEPGTKFGSKAYSREELIAEIGSNLIAGELGVEIDEKLDNSVAYIQGWLSAFRNDVSMVVSAMQEAQKATDYFLEKESYYSEKVA